MSIKNHKIKPEISKTVSIKNIEGKLNNLIALEKDILLIISNIYELQLPELTKYLLKIRSNRLEIGALLDKAKLEGFSFD